MIAHRTRIQQALLAWFAAHQRKLPWRAGLGDPPMDPYRVVVSELMLQQTRVDTVVGYFLRWCARFPTVRDLAAADESDVLAAWTGLGYYTRARNLHRLARRVVENHDGAIPRDPDEIQALPGIGPYTAAAVRSIAFGQPAPLVDGNVARVLARWHGLAQDVMQGSGKQAVWQLAESWLASGPARTDPGAWNQALMELGATVCVPRRPDCARCPVATDCVAFAAERQDEMPAPRKRTPVVPVAADYLVLWRKEGPQRNQLDLAQTCAGQNCVELISLGREVGSGGPARWSVLVGRRPSRGRWAGLWEPPGSEGGDARTRIDRWLGPHAAGPDADLGRIVHVLTHRRYEVTARAVQSVTQPDLAPLGYVDARWLPVDDLLGRNAGVSRLGQRLVQRWLDLAADMEPAHPVPPARRRRSRDKA